MAFSRIVSLLVRSPHYKHYALSDLEWLVIPPVALGQCATMEANANGRSVPIAAAFWASVSDEVDKKLSENLSAPLKLRPDEWRSGDTLWLVDAIGDPKAVPELLKQLHETAFKDRRIKIRKRVAPGNPSVES